MLFGNYLRNDPTIDRAQQVTSTALHDAERAALDAHRRGNATAETVTVTHDFDEPLPRGRVVGVPRRGVIPGDRQALPAVPLGLLPLRQLRHHP